jgi:hypothetical protein
VKRENRKTGVKVGNGNYFDYCPDFLTSWSHYFGGMNQIKEITCNATKSIAVLSENGRGYTKEVNLVAKGYEIRVLDLISIISFPCLHPRRQW